MLRLQILILRQGISAVAHLQKHKTAMQWCWQFDPRRPPVSLDKSLEN